MSSTTTQRGSEASTDGGSPVRSLPDRSGSGGPAVLRPGPRLFCCSIVTPLLFLGLSLGLPAASGARQVPRFERGPCPFQGGEWLEAETIDCGTIVVPESRDRPDGRILRLAVAVLRSRAEQARPDPVVFLQGGPGGAAVRHTRAMAESRLINAVRQNRDYIVWDQRGTGYSDPAFCPDLSPRYLALGYAAIDAAERVRATLELVAECRRRMDEEGLDLSAYNSATSARDLNDLRQALGYEEWNLFGGSYGTRLALTALRETPTGIRSVILDAVSPPSVSPDEVIANFASSLHLVLARCREDRACASEFPNLEDTLYAALDELDAEPVTVSVSDTARFPDGHVVLNGRTVAAGLFQGLYSPDFIEVLPYAIRELRAGNRELVASLAESLAPDPETENPWQAEAVECFEQEPLSSPAAIAEAKERFPELSRIHDPSVSAVCDAWQPHRADPRILRQPVVSDIPALVASGELDPITPPRYGRLVAEHLPNSQVVEAPGLAHGALFPTECTRELTVSFLDDPRRTLDTSCLDELPSTSFVTGLHVTPAVARTARLVSGGPDRWMVAWVAATGLLLASGLIGWPVIAGIRRLRRARTSETEDRERSHRALARLTAGLAAVAVLGFAVGLGLVVRGVAADNALVLAFGVPGSAAPLLWLPWIVALLSLGCIAFAVQAMRKGWWSRWGRLHYLLVTLSCVSLVVLLQRMGFILG